MTLHDVVLVYFSIGVGACLMSHALDIDREGLRGWQIVIVDVAIVSAWWVLFIAMQDLHWLRRRGQR